MSNRFRLMWCVGALLVPAALLAHARLTGSRPADHARLRMAPTAIQLEFSETPEVALTTIKLSGPDGSAIPLGPVERSPRLARGVTAPIRAKLEAGVYRVGWSTAAEDGHPMRGVFTFEVLPAVPPPPVTANGIGGGGESGLSHTAHPAPVSPTDVTSVSEQSEGFGVESPAYVVIRWLQFLSLLVVIGAVAFRQLVLSFLKRKENPDSPMIPDAARNAARWGHRAAAVLLLMNVIRLVAQSYMMHGGMGGVAPAMMTSMVARTMWGRGWLLQLAGVAIAGLGFHMARRSDSSRWWGIATLGAVLLAFSPAFAGHASSSPRLTALAILADGLHVLSAGGWLGSLVMVVAAGIPAALRLPTGRRGPMVAEVVNAFSPTALTFAGILGATGVFAAWVHLGSVTALWTSGYGKTLLIKLSILSGVAATGAYNWLRVKPHLGRVEGAAKMTRSAVLELGFGVVVVLVTAVLVAMSTPHDADLTDSPAPPVVRNT